MRSSRWGLAWAFVLFLFVPVSRAVLGPVDLSWHVLLMVVAEPSHINSFQAFGDIKSVDISLAKASHMATLK